MCIHFLLKPRESVMATCEETIVEVMIVTDSENDVTESVVESIVIMEEINPVCFTFIIQLHVHV